MEHPITPPPKLVNQWETEMLHESGGDYLAADMRWFATQAARWGADAELEACCEWLKAKVWIHPEFSDELRDARRSKPLSLKEQALEILGRVSKDQYPCNYQDDEDWDTIRLALESIPDSQD
jgi:hypothetical protein